MLNLRQIISSESIKYFLNIKYIKTLNNKHPQWSRCKLAENVIFAMAKQSGTNGKVIYSYFWGRFYSSDIREEGFKNIKKQSFQHLKDLCE